jgi:hypothetical protein
MSGRRNGIAIALAAALLAACAGSEEPAGTVAPTESTAERRPVRMTVRCTPSEATVGEKVTLTIEVTAEEGVEIAMPEVGETVGPFQVRRAERPPDVPEEGRRRWTHTYVLDTFTPGPAEIPAFTVGMRDGRDADDLPIEGELASDPLTLTVATVLAGGETEADFRDIRADVDVPVPVAPRTVLTVVGGVVAALVVVALVILLWMRRRRRAAREPVVPAHVWARAELEALAAAGLVERGDVHGLYVRLTDIVRMYIERRFGLMAPERTTEEFLREAGRFGGLETGHQVLLSGFLRAADMVKFARHEPSATESRDAFEAAEGFVDETAVVETTGAGARGDAAEAAA